MKKIAVVFALIGCGFLVGQAYHPAKAAAGSVDNIVFELQQLRQAAQDIASKMDCR